MLQLRWLNLRRTTAILTIAVLTAVAQAGAAPTTMTYQGRLTGPDGLKPLTGNFNMEFRIFANPAGGQPLWGEVFNNQYHGPVSVNELGLFEVILGDSVPLTSSLFPSDSNRYLEITVGGENLSPRKPLNSVPYALTLPATGGVIPAWPIGSVFISVVSTNPATLLGFGSWVPFATGRMLVGINGADADFDTVEETGGTKQFNNVHTHTGPSHTHDLSNHVHAGPSHNHQILNNGIYDSVGQFVSGTMTATSPASGDMAGLYRPHLPASDQAWSANSGSGNTGTPSSNTSGAAGAGATGSGGSASQSVVNPYIVVYMWKRTS